jgi:hypothetical protein
LYFYLFCHGQTTLLKATNSLGSLIAPVLVFPSVYHQPLFLLGSLFTLKMEVVNSSETVGIYLPNYMVSHLRIP